MPLKTDINEGDRWFANAAFKIKLRVWEADGVTPRDVSGYALSWMLKRRQADADLAAVLTKTTPTITITGVFHSDPAVNTQLVEIPITDANTVSVPGGIYRHELKRVDPGLETVLCSGSANLRAPLHKTVV